MKSNKSFLNHCQREQTLLWLQTHTHTHTIESREEVKEPQALATTIAIGLHGKTIFVALIILKDKTHESHILWVLLLSFKSLNAPFLPAHK